MDHKEHSERLLKLTATLRSGEYEQTIRRLHTSEGFCCLGVACDLYIKETGIGEWVPVEMNLPFEKLTVFRFKHPDDEKDDAGGISVLPEAVSDWYGIDNAGLYSNTGSVAKLNDDGKPFAAIADFIDNNHSELFAKKN